MKISLCSTENIYSIKQDERTAEIHFKGGQFFGCNFFLPENSSVFIRDAGSFKFLLEVARQIKIIEREELKNTKPSTNKKGGRK